MNPSSLSGSVILFRIGYGIWYFYYNFLQQVMSLTINDDQLKELLAIIDQKFSESTISQSSRKSLLGSLPGLIKHIGSDFNEPLEDLEDYMPNQHPSK